MNSTTTEKLNKIYAGQGFQKKEKLRCNLVQKKMQKNSWEIAARKEKPVQGTRNLLTVSHS